jgi:tetratricopeptide (TPR) repeat protein
LQPGNAEAAYRLGGALLQQGNAREALVELKRANQLKPEMPETLFSLGKAASMTGENTVAEQSWLKVIELEKNTAIASKANSLNPNKKCKNSKNCKAPFPASLTVAPRHERIYFLTMCMVFAVKLNYSTGRPILFVPITRQKSIGESSDDLPAGNTVRQYRKRP